MTTKIAVSLPDEQVAAARAAVAEGRAPSVSAYVSEALARRSAEEELLELLDQDEITGEPAGDQHRAWAQRALSTEEPEPAEETGDAPGVSTGGRSAKVATTGRYTGKSSATRHASKAVDHARSSSRRG